MSFDTSSARWPALGGTRFWDYDTAFNNVSNLPPFTPIVAQVKSTGWWE